MTGGEPAGVLVVHCSDPRYQIPFQDFLRKKLGIERYALLAVPGGPQFLTLVELLPKFAWAGWRWVKFLGDIGSGERVILIAHEDCRWYLERFGHAPANLRDKQLSDMRQVSAGLRERFPRARVELYYARMSGESPVIEPLS